MDYKNSIDDISILINSINDEFIDYIDDKYDIYI
jgi:hypothetical protein